MAKRCFMNLPKAPPLSREDPYPIFTRFSMDTSGGCNKNCPFCAQCGRDPKEPMTDKLYESICRQLGELKYRGIVQMWYIGEPLFDPNIIERCALLRNHVPRCCIFICSNGELLESAQQVEDLLDAGVNNINFNCYNDKTLRRIREMLPDIIPGARWGRVGHATKRVSFNDSRHMTDLHDWTNPKVRKRLDAIAKKRPWAIRKVSPTGKCARPMRHLSIANDGLVPICCAKDYEVVERFVGDANKQTLLELWNSDMMYEYRKMLQDGDRSKECLGCTATMAMAHVVQRVK